MINQDRCRTCGTRIYWLRHERTKRFAPIEVDVRDDGNVAIDLDTDTYRLWRGGSPESHAAQEWHWNHFGRCPQAKFWRTGAM